MAAAVIEAGACAGGGLLMLYFLPLAYDKQKILLSSEAGHFSLVRALHMADYITELNGTTRRSLLLAPSRKR